MVSFIKTLIKNKQLAWLFSLLYFSSYVTRINLSAIVQEVISSTGFMKSQFSIVLVCLSVAYGLGQIVNGRLGDKIFPPNLIFMGLCIASAMNLIFPLFSYSIPIMCVLWTINGFAQSMMWPPMIKIMASTMDDSTYHEATVIVQIGSSVGTVLIYLISPLIIKSFGWQTVMYSSAAIGVLSTVIWFFFKNRCYGEDNIIVKSQNEQKATDKKFKIPRLVVFPFALILIGIALQGMIRDGVTNWMPTYLSETAGFTNEKSIFLTVSLAIFSLLSFIIANWVYKKFFSDEVSCATVIFLFSAICAVLLFVLFGAGSSAATVLLMTLITGGMHGVNLMLISHVPKRFAKYGNVSTVSGLVNSFTYVGAAVATYGIAKIAEVFGWKTTVAVWAVILILGTTVCLLAIPKWKKFIEN